MENMGIIRLLLISIRKFICHGDYHNDVIFQRMENVWFASKDLGVYVSLDMVKIGIKNTIHCKCTLAWSFNK